jgi:hypothetical protein
VDKNCLAYYRVEAAKWEALGGEKRPPGRPRSITEEDSLRAYRALALAAQGRHLPAFARELEELEPPLAVRVLGLEAEQLAEL